MNPRSPTSSGSATDYPSKRARHSPPDDTSPLPIVDAASSGAAQHGGRSLPLSHSSSSFRNVSACNRCRLRKNRCDQRLPACASCEKAQVQCVGYDPITKREIPRRYVSLLHCVLIFFFSKKN